MRKQLVLVGGGHAHMMILENISRFIEKGIKVTVIGPSFYHYYSGMGPGMLGGTYTPDDIRFATKDVVQKQGGIFVKDHVNKIDADKCLVYTESGHTFDYDALSFNAGSFVPIKESLKGAGNIYSVKPIERLMEASEKLKDIFVQKKISLSIVGGGPSSAEIAGNVWQLATKIRGHMPDIQIFAGKKFMARFPETVRKRVRSILSKRGITINETGYVKEVTRDTILLETQKAFATDFIFMAQGVKPSRIFEDSWLPVGPDKGLIVNKYLQSIKYPLIFGGGDCIYYKDQPLDKVGVYAVRQNPVLLHNLSAILEGEPLKPFNPGPDYLMIFNLGHGIGVLKKRGLVFDGRIAFIIKNYIDRKFMKKFQVIEKKL
ncbi:MAG: FAD-dependent oxidoreductase [Desulfobacula sp.]|nr:FAD-dependent oxidoreductase [Desulfobacula sp.]